MSEKLIIAVDFDNTIVRSSYTSIIGEVPGAIDVLKKLQEKCYLILWTVKDKELLSEAIDYCNERGIHFWGHNINPDQRFYNFPASVKIFSHFYIDDRALGCPLIYPDDGAPYVDWVLIEDFFKKNNIL